MENYSDVVQAMLLNSRGLPEETIVLLLLIPILSTLIAIFRHIVGLSTSGYYISILFGLSFYFLGKDDFKGLIYGVPITIIVMGLAILFRNLTRNFRFHYLPRMSLLVSLISIFTLIGSGVATVLTDGAISLQMIFPVLVIIVLAERFITLLIRKNEQLVITRIGESILFGGAAYLVLTWEFLRKLLLTDPWIVIIALLLNILVAGSSSLRLSEFLRFKEVYREDAKEKETQAQQS